MTCTPTVRRLLPAVLPEAAGSPRLRHQLRPAIPTKLVVGHDTCRVIASLRNLMDLFQRQTGHGYQLLVRYTDPQRKLDGESLAIGRLCSHLIDMQAVVGGSPHTVQGLLGRHSQTVKQACCRRPENWTLVSNHPPAGGSWIDWPVIG